MPSKHLQRKPSANAHSNTIKKFTRPERITANIDGNRVDTWSATVLGCGTSVGVPALGCNCSTCQSKNPKNNRLRASIALQYGDTVFLIDTTPDLRQQSLRENLYWIDAVLYTHPHADHLHGIDDLRTFNFLKQGDIDCFGNKWTTDTILNRYEYIFKVSQEGGGKPKLNVHTVTKSFFYRGLKIQPLEVIHGSMPVLGYRIGSFAYITDCSHIPEKTIRKMQNLDVLILDCLRYTPHSTHLTVEQALAYAARIKAKTTYLTHMGHELDYVRFKKTLPKHVYPAYDGLKITLTTNRRRS